MPLTKQDIQRAKRLQKQLDDRSGTIGALLHMHGRILLGLPTCTRRMKPPTAKQAKDHARESARKLSMCMSKLGTSTANVTRARRP